MGQAEDHQAATGQVGITRHALSAASGMSDVSEPERAIVEAHSRPNAPLIHEIIRAEGESELSREIPALLLSGLAAGLAMGFSLMTEGLLTAIYGDGDACPVREDAYRVASCLGLKAFVVSNGPRPIRPPGLANVAMITVVEGADVADDWIAECITAADAA